MDGISLVWSLCVALVAHQHGKPLPKKVLTATADHWSVTLNSTNVASGDLPPFGVRVESTRFLIIGVLDPFGGVIGGCSEDVLIEDLKAAMPESEWSVFFDAPAA